MVTSNAMATMNYINLKLEVAMGGILSMHSNTLWPMLSPVGMTTRIKKW